MRYLLMPKSLSSLILILFISLPSYAGFSVNDCVFIESKLDLEEDFVYVGTSLRGSCESAGIARIDADVTPYSRTLKALEVGRWSGIEGKVYVVGNGDPGSAVARIESTVPIGGAESRAYVNVERGGIFTAEGFKVLGKDTFIEVKDPTSRIIARWPSRGIVLNPSENGEVSLVATNGGAIQTLGAGNDLVVAGRSTGSHAKVLIETGGVLQLGGGLNVGDQRTTTSRGDSSVIIRDGGRAFIDENIEIGSLNGESKISLFSYSSLRESRIRANGDINIGGNLVEIGHVKLLTEGHLSALGPSLIEANNINISSNIIQYDAPNRASTLLAGRNSTVTSNTIHVNNNGRFVLDGGNVNADVFIDRGELTVGSDTSYEAASINGSFASYAGTLSFDAGGFRVGEYDSLNILGELFLDNATIIDVLFDTRIDWDSFAGQSLSLITAEYVENFDFSSLGLNILGLHEGFSTELLATDYGLELALMDNRIPTEVPEPSSFALMLIWLIFLTVRAIRRPR